MSPCRIELLSPEEAKAAAQSANVIAAFADLNIFRAMLRRPKTAKAMSDLLLSLLFGGELDDRLRELLIMRIGWVTGSDYEWTQHWRIAQDQFGCSEQDLLELRVWRDSDHFGADEKLLLAATDDLLETGDLRPELTTQCLAQFGENATIELVTAVGAWRLVSKFTKALEIPLEEGVASWPPTGAPPTSAERPA
jgi:alkylhydroperoxidase family enzyme